MEPIIEPFLVIVFPDVKSKEALRELAPRLLDGLKKASKSDPLLVSPDATAICVLVEGSAQAISKAVDLARGTRDRFIMICADAPFQTCGLSAAHQWLERRTG